MADKKYYWYKLNDLFFKNKKIQFLEKVTNGYLYCDVFLKLLCRSDYFNRNTRMISIKRNMVNPNLFLSSMCRQPVAIITQALIQLSFLGLVTIDDNKLLLNDICIDVDRNRTTKEYKNWRVSVFQRDNYTCVICGKKGCKLNAHHKKQWAYYKEMRFDINNGITLCEKCHKELHRKERSNARKKILLVKTTK